MEIEYLPNIGFKINSKTIKWGDKRESVRLILGNEHQDDDRVVELSQYFDGDESQNIIQKRDIYKNFHANDNYFFLNYTDENKVSELEVHWGMNIKIGKVILKFGREMSTLITELVKLDNKCREIDEGEYLFKNLKILIANNEATGGDGKGLSYFYAASDIGHLDE